MKMKMKMKRKKFDNYEWLPHKRGRQQYFMQLIVSGIAMSLVLLEIFYHPSLILLSAS
jgi:hypothetical protein